jgi:NitT/TauT family transport system permease protein
MSAVQRIATAFREVSAVVGLVVVWQAVTVIFAVPAFLLPQPTVVARAFADNLDVIAAAVVQTSAEAALGFVGGNALGLALAVLFTRWRQLERLGLPLAIALRSIPLVAITPLLTIVFGFGPLTIIVMAVLISFFPALVAGTMGLRAPSAEALALMRVLDAPDRVLYRRLRIPAALPYIFAAFKISAPASVLAAMVAEWTAANSGLGYLILDAGGRYRFPLMWAAIVGATALAVAAFALASVAERRVIRWPVETA